MVIHLMENVCIKYLLKKKGGVQVETGELIYGHPKGFGFVMVVLIVFGGIWYPLFFSSKVQFSWADHWPLLLISILFVSIPGINILKTKRNEKFYEYGIGHFKKNKLVHFESYDTFVFVECYHKRVASGDDRKSYYCLAFWRADGSYVELKRKISLRDLKKNWEQILLHSPSLRSRLECYLDDPNSKKLYETLKNESYQV